MIFRYPGPSRNLQCKTKSCFKNSYNTNCSFRSTAKFLFGNIMLLPWKGSIWFSLCYWFLDNMYKLCILSPLITNFYLQSDFESTSNTISCFNLNSSACFRYIVILNTGNIWMLPIIVSCVSWSFFWHHEFVIFILLLVYW